MTRLSFTLQVILMFAVSLTFSGSDEAGVDVPIERFSKVDENIYRGAQPDKDGFRYLKNLGIKKVINFRAEKKLAAEDRTFLESLGIEYIHIPWRIYTPYDPEAFKSFFSAIKDREENPVFFHCRRGSERTGVMAAAYQIKFLNKSADEAIQYAEQFDLSRMWKVFVTGKIKEFESRTGAE